MKHASGSITTRNDKASMTSSAESKPMKDGGKPVAGIGKPVQVKKSEKIR